MGLFSIIGGSLLGGLVSKIGDKIFGGSSKSSGVGGVIGQGIGSAIQGIGSGFGQAAGSALNQYGQNKFNSISGFNNQSGQVSQDPISGLEGGKEARDFMETLYGPDVSPWDWLGSSNSANSGATQAPQIRQDRDRLRTEERIAKNNNATQRYVSDNSVKATRYAADMASGASRYGADTSAGASRYGADTSAGASRYGADTSADASRYGADRAYDGIERVQGDPYRIALLQAQAAESRIRAKFDQAQISVAKQDAILREYQISYTKSMTNLNAAQTSATYENLEMAWRKLPVELQWIKQQTLTSEQQRIMLEVGNVFQAARTILPKITFGGEQLFGDPSDESGTQAAADLWSLTFLVGGVGAAAKGAGPLMRAGKGAVSGAKSASVGAKAFMQAYQLSRKQGNNHIRSIKAGLDYIMGKPAAAR